MKCLKYSTLIVNASPRMIVLVVIDEKSTGNASVHLPFLRQCGHYVWQSHSSLLIVNLCFCHDYLQYPRLNELNIVHINYSISGKMSTGT